MVVGIISLFLFGVWIGITVTVHWLFAEEIKRGSTIFTKDREFFTRCPSCAKDSMVIVKRSGDRELLLKPVECKKHPKEAIILFPQDVQWVDN